MSDNKYFPLNEQQFNELKNTLADIKDYIHESKMSYIWNTFKLVSGSIENQPCSCASAAGHWVRAVNALRDFVSKVENQ